MRDQARTQEVLRKLHDLGVLITLDDFGTCFATLNYLRSFPFKKIKIDRSFVRDIPEHHDCVAIVKSVADLARELNMRSVAEGVETAASLAAVRAAGYNEAQGFYFSPPVRASGVKRAVKQCALRLAALDAGCGRPTRAAKQRRARGSRSRRSGVDGDAALHLVRRAEVLEVARIDLLDRQDDQHVGGAELPVDDRAVADDTRRAADSP